MRKLKLVKKIRKRKSPSNLIVGGLFFIYFLLCVYQVKAQEILWDTYFPEDSSYVISLPRGQTTISSDTIKTTIGSLIMTKVMNKSQINNTETYAVISCVKYPIGTFHSDSIHLHEEFWDATVAQSVENVKGEILYRASEYVGGWPACVWKIAYNKDRTMDNLGVLQKRRFYLLQFSSSGSIELTSVKNRFFKSLYLMK